MTLWQWMSTFWKRFVVVGAVLFPWVGAVLVALAGGFAIHSWLLMRNGIHAQATITENVPVQASDGVVLYQTHARFRLPSGELVTFTDPVASSDDAGPSFTPGSVVPVIYPAGRPNSAVIATTWRVYSSAIIFGVLAVVFLDLGIILRRIRRQQIA